DGVCDGSFSGPDFDDCGVCFGTSFTDFDNDGISDECDEYPWGEVTVTYANNDDTIVGDFGSFDIIYDSQVDIYGFQFNISGVTIESATTDNSDFSVSVNPSNGNVVGFSLSGGFYPSGSSTLCTITYRYDSGDVTTCIGSSIFAVNFSGSLSAQMWDGDCINVFEPPVDCAGTHNGDLVDDVCGVCDGSGTTVYCEDVDADGLGFGNSGDFCPDGTPGFNVPEGYVDNCDDECPLDPNNDIDNDSVCGDVDNCPDDANTDQTDFDADGSGDVCDATPDGEIGVVFGDVDGVNGTFDINYDTDSYNNSVDVYGFQFVVSGVTLVEASTTNSDFTVSVNPINGQVIGFSLTQGSYPAGVGTLATITFEVGADREISLSGVTIAGDVGHSPIAYTGGPVNTGLCDADGLDSDGDLWGDSCDNCPDAANFDQADADGDMIGDVCDDCSLDPDNDSDADGVCGEVDNCPADYNPDQEDFDGDGAGDVCDDDIDGDTVLNVDDNCPEVVNPDQADLDEDMIGDVCDDDVDGDDVLNVDDNCPEVANTDQADMDNDTVGDLCDDDNDNDGIADVDDNCPYDANADQANFDNAELDGSILGDVCDPSPLGDVDVFYANIDSVNGSFDIMYNSNVNVYGFFFELTGIDVLTYTSTVLTIIQNNNTVTGYSPFGASHPAGSGTLLHVTFDTATAGNDVCVNGEEQFYGVNNNFLAFGGYCSVIPAPPILEVELAIELSTGWNWFSVNVEAADMSLDNVLSNINGTADFIKDQTSFASYVDGYGWFGTLNTLSTTSMYQIHTTEPGTILYTGLQVDPTTPLELTSGWNWISYLPACDLSIGSALGSIDGSSDFVKNQTQFSSYVEGYGWFGSLTTMTVNDGFKLHMLEAGTLTYPGCDVAASGMDETEDVEFITELVRNNVDWNVNPHDYEFNGSIFVNVEIDGFDVATDTDYLAVFVGDECRGISSGITNPITERVVYPMMVYSNEEDEIVTFRFYQESSQMVFGFENSVQFNANMFNDEALTLTGSYDWNRGPIPTEYALDAAYPNPFNPVTTMNYAIVNDGSINITVYDITGRAIEVLVNEYKSAGSYSVTWNAGQMPSGLYLVRMESGSFVGVQKVMLVK
ncbi:MAG: thrombospondin type 3 repeat-containing protein, partial [Fidelibacterota bacterium]